MYNNETQKRLNDLKKFNNFVKYEDLFLLFQYDENLRKLVFNNSNSNNNYNENNSNSDENSNANSHNFSENENNALQHKINSLNNTITDLQNKLNFANNSAENLKKKYEDLVEKNQNILTENNSLINEVKNLESKLQNAQKYNMPEDLIALINALEHLKTQSNLAKIWLGENYNTNSLTINIKCFIARAGNWSNIELFWDALCSLCQSSKQQISEQNLQILTMLIQLYNYSRSDNKQANLLFSLREMDSNRFNSFIQTRANFCISGENVVTELLPGLKSAFDKITKTAIVITQD